MTNVLLKNVHFQYALKLWNYLSDQMEIKDKAVKAGKMIEEKGITKKLVDEDIYLMNLIFSNKILRKNLKVKEKMQKKDKKQYKY